MKKINKKYSKHDGFTLVELSIVIIIIGFLIAGISAGQSLIKQAALSSVISDMQDYQAAYNGFIIRYDAVPGDMTNPDAYWPAGPLGCSISPGDCNGNGDGLVQIYQTASAVNVDEPAFAWRELSLANMISAGIVVLPNVTNGFGGPDVLGVTAPASKITEAGYSIIGSDTYISLSEFSYTISPWSDGYTNATFIGKVSALVGLGKEVFTPSEAFNLDQKIDDGVIDNNGNAIGGSTGRFRSTIGDNSFVTLSCVNSNIYDLSQTTPQCVSGLALN